MLTAAAVVTVPQPTALPSTAAAAARTTTAAVPLVCDAAARGTIATPAPFPAHFSTSTLAPDQWPQPQRQRRPPWLQPCRQSRELKA